MGNASVIGFFKILPVAVLLTACGPALYLPNSINVPLLEKKGDFKLSTGIVGATRDFQWDLQGSYAVTDHLAVMANSSRLDHPMADLKTYNHYLDGGLGGYFSKAPNKYGVNVFRGELFVGYGKGRAQYVEKNGNYAFGDFDKFFLQPGIGVRTRNFDISLAARFSNVEFKDYGKFENDHLSTGGSFGFGNSESVLTVGFGHKRVKFHIQIGTGGATGNVGSYRKVTRDFGGGHFNYGISYSPWREPLVPSPQVVFTMGPEETGDSLSDPNKELIIKKVNPKIRIPLLTITTGSKDIAVCLSTVEPMDSVRLGILFKGGYLAQNLNLDNDPACFELSVIPDEENLFYILAVSERNNIPKTLEITVREREKVKKFFLSVKTGRVEIVKFKTS